MTKKSWLKILLVASPGLVIAGYILALPTAGPKYKFLERGRQLVHSTQSGPLTSIGLTKGASEERFYWFDEQSPTLDMAIEKELKHKGFLEDGDHFIRTFYGGDEVELVRGRLDNNTFFVLPDGPEAVVIVKSPLPETWGTTLKVWLDGCYKPRPLDFQWS